LSIEIINRGEWLNNLKHGYGLLQHRENKYFYEGQFVNDRKHGHGRLTIRKANLDMQRSYVGQWQDDAMHGYGTLYLDSDAYYEGEFIKNKRTGHGRMQYENGDV
jgi:hypothetical protein